MKHMLLIGVLLLNLTDCKAQVIGGAVGKPATQLEPIERMMRDSVGPDDVVIAVEVDSLCRLGRKRILQDIPNGCAAAAMQMVDPKVELQLMKFMRFDCRVNEITLVFRCEYTD